jgi:hypothetical protein
VHFAHAIGGPRNIRIETGAPMNKKLLLHEGGAWSPCAIVYIALQQIVYMYELTRKKPGNAPGLFDPTRERSMPYARTVSAADSGAFTQDPVRIKFQPKRGAWRRFWDAMLASRQRQAERDIAQFLHMRGSKLTDEAEREIERRFLLRASDKF